MGTFMEARRRETRRGLLTIATETLCRLSFMLKSRDGLLPVLKDLTVAGEGPVERRDWLKCPDGVSMISERCFPSLLVVKSTCDL